MKRYLVTGAQGFVGRFVVAHLLRHNECDVLGIGRSNARDGFTHSITWNEQSIPAPLPDAIPVCLLSQDNYHYEPADLEDRNRLSQLVQSYRPHFIIHLASGLFGDPAQKLFRCNVEGTINLLESIPHDSCIKRIVLGSSGGVYGRVSRIPIRESDAPNPIHMYSVSKFAAELAAQVTASGRGLPLVIARLFNIVGPGQDERHACGRWMQQLVSIAHGLPPELHVGSLDATRDFIDVRDTASACVHLCQHGVAGQIYNAATGVETQMREVLQACVEIAELSAVVQVHETYQRDADIPRHAGDIGKLKSTGWSPQYSLTESLKDLYRYYAGIVPVLPSPQQLWRS